MPESDQSFEYRFSAGPARIWRVVRSPLEGLFPSAGAWVRMTTPGGTRQAWLGSRLAVQTRPGTPLPAGLLARLGLVVDRETGKNQWILQARDPWAAAQAATVLASAPGIEAAQPVMKRGLALHGGFAPRPDDPYFTGQWHLENRDASGQRLGPDLNPRAAWATTRGEGIIIAICDNGFETAHPDLRQAASGAPHFDFTVKLSTPGVYGSHSTCVAGLAAATGDNGIGVSGVAPAARLASWPIFDGFSSIASDEALGDMFRYRLQEVAVQNHSWGNADSALSAPSMLEATAISDATELGRGGRGVLMVRSGGNEREISSDTNADGYGNDPRVIAVAAVRDDGRVASYSTPGACLLVAAPSGDDTDTFAPTRTIFSTDRVGARGYNRSDGGTELLDYAFGTTGFSGTSASAPMISGLVALILAANPQLTIRDVQQVLIHAARHHDLADPDLRTNAAGYRVSHSVGFGVPDAGQAVRLARAWSNRPPLVAVSNSWAGVLAIPDAGLRASVWGGNNIQASLPAAPGTGAHPDQPTARLPLVYVGLVTNAITEDLHGKAALIERGMSYFRDKLNRATQAGAEFAIVFNHEDGDAVFVPGGTDFIPIPAVMIGEDNGRALVARGRAGERLEAQLGVEAASTRLTLTNRLLCEHVGLRVRARHDRRGDLRLELISPAGTRSILQRLNDDLEPGPEDWTYWSVHHYCEPASGTWTVTVSDQREGNTGEITDLTLVVRGIPLEDSDEDGLDDRWERTWFGDLRPGPTEDPDHDGSPNAREQVLGANPLQADQPLRLEFAALDPGGRYRLAWPTASGVGYRVLGSRSASDPGTELGRLLGTFPEAEWITPVDPAANQFFRLEVTPP